MQCPACQSKLVHAKYADANVRECPGCHGLLLASSRSKKIEKRVNKDVKALLEEMASPAVGDITDVIRCPACRDKMKKIQKETLGFNIDECHQCGVSWFDGGELAAMQLAYENREQTVEMHQMRDRLRNMTDEEKEEYEKRIANLKDLGTIGEQAIRSSTFRLSVWYWWSMLT